MADYGIKVSIPTVDVKIASPENCTIHSGYPNIKIKTEASPAHFATLDYSFTSDPANGTLTLFTKAHGYSYISMAIVYVDDLQFTPNRFTVLPEYFVYDGNGYQKLWYDVDSTNLYIKYSVTNNPSGTHVNVNGFDFKFKYYIFVDKD